MMSEPTSKQTSKPSQVQPRFGIFTLMLVTLIFCCMAAAGRYLLMDGANKKAFFVVFTLAAPALIVVGINVVRFALSSFRRRR